jgi:hypothetical protein
MKLALILSGLMFSGLAFAETVKVGAEVEGARQGIAVMQGNYGLALGQSIDGKTTDLGLRYQHVIPVANGFAARLGIEAGATSEVGNYKPAAYSAGFTQGVGVQVGPIGVFTDLAVHTSMDATTHRMAPGLALSPRIGIDYAL